MVARFGRFCMRDLRRLDRGGMHLVGMLERSVKRVSSRRGQKRAILERFDQLIARLPLQRGRRTSKAPPEFPINHGKPPSEKDYVTLINSREAWLISSVYTKNLSRNVDCA